MKRNTCVYKVKRCLKNLDAAGARGSALIVVLMILAMLSLLGLALTFNGMTEARISDNYEADTKALMLAEAGLNRALNELRGKSFTSILLGPNGVADTSLSQASTFDFRNPIPLNTAGIDPRSLNISDNSQVAAATINDDGIIPTIGQLGVRYFVRPGPDGVLGTADDQAFFENETAMTASDVPIGRYFVKISNNPDDPGGPFKDTDFTLIIRSMGIAKANPGEVGNPGGGNIRNSVAIIEAKVRIDMTFKTDSPFTVAGPSVMPTGTRFFDGNTYQLTGNQYLGISVINTTGAYTDPVNEPNTQQLLSAPFAGNTQGGGLNPSIRNITGNVMNGQTWSGAANPDATSLMNAQYVSNFISKVGNFADYTFTSDVGNAAIMGTISNPLFVYVNSNLSVSSNVSGAGLLIVTGTLLITGNLNYNGIILVVGPNAAVDIRGNPTITGGLFTANIVNVGGVPTYSTARFTLRGNITSSSNTDYVSMAFTLLPLVQVQWREIRPEVEP